MSGRLGPRLVNAGRGNNDSDRRDSAQLGLGNAFLQAEEQFHANSQEKKEEWKVQRGRNVRPSRSRNNDDHISNTAPGGNQQRRSESQGGRGRGTKRPQYSEASNKRPLQNSESSNKRDKSDFKGSGRQNQQQKQEEEMEQDINASSSGQNRRERNPPGFTFTKLQQISAKDSTDIIRILANSKSGLDEFLSGKIKPDFMYLIVKILSKLTASDWEENKEHVLMRAATPEFFKKITEFVTFLVTDEQNYKRREEMEQFFDNLLTFFQAVLTMLPTVAAEHLMAPLRATRMAMGGVTEFQNVTINEKLQEKMKHLMFEFEERKKEKEEREQIIREEKEMVYAKPLGSISTVPLYPRPEDIASSRSSVYPNKIKGPYASVEHYLDVQFRLLREDFIAPIRQGINELRGIYSEGKSQGKKKRINNIKIYQKVRFLKPKVISDKVGYEICFDPEKKLKINWEHSKRFIFGSLLLFTTDNFHTFFIATVVNRDLKVIEKDRTISVVLCDTGELAQDILSKEFLMAESEVYYEPYYCVLKALQKFNSESFPMKKYFVYVETRTAQPAYTRNGSDVYTITAGEYGRKAVRLFDDSTWWSANELGFDEFQLRAFKAALTNDLAIIQGPPGTGKTYLGLKITAALLENAAVWNYDHKTPILVICYTNHALDQFLEGVLELTNNLVRIGGRGKSEMLEQFNLRERRKHVAFYSNHEQASLLKDLKKEMSGIFEGIKMLQDNLEHLDKNDGILSLKSLKIAMSSDHQEAFRNNDDLLNWLLLGVRNKISSYQNLVPSGDKAMSRSNTEKLLEEFQFDPSDFENITRLKEVLFDSVELEDPSDDPNNPNSVFQMYFCFTLEEIQKKIEENANLLESLPNSEGTRECIQKKMLQARKTEGDLKLMLEYFEERLKCTGIPTQEDTNRVYAVKDVNMLSSNQRWILYKSWVEFVKSGYWMLIGKLEERYRKGVRRYDEVRQFDDLKIVQQADVVGVTTTTAARLQAMLRELRPKIVIVEEAAEILEAHIIASLSVYCQHLILIGDHKQLRPSPADYRIGKDCHLDVSLFERLINNGVSFHTLRTQHRMRPEISRLLVPSIYDSLIDHQTTLNRPHIRGTDHSVFFFNHNHFEEEVADIVSKRNLFEARMVMSLARHLLLQGYRPDEITVLTTYSGQMYLMKDEQKRLDISKDMLVTNVDNYQGEENKIILLSLVRSNKENKIGFLKTNNRVCVALSRARDGLFVFGNMDCLTADSVLWQQIRKTFIDMEGFGPALILRCETHRNQLTKVATPADWSQVMEGGCNRPCNEMLPCGHHCRSLCHVTKDRHKRYRCSEPCNRNLCVEGHPCNKKCYQQCGQCETAMLRTLDCGHKITLPCCVDYSKIQCKKTVVLSFQACGHNVEVECYRRHYKDCPEPCPYRLECGHACDKPCHVTDDPDHLEYQCPKPCPRRPVGCTEGHKCPLACYDECKPCTRTVVKELPCGHTKTTPCINKDLRCDLPCPKTLPCGHACPRLCHQECGGCPVMVGKTVQLCGHKVQVACSAPATKADCTGQCSVKLECGHKCQKRCKDQCTMIDCTQPTPLAVALPCGHFGALLPCNLVQRGGIYNITDKEELVQYCSEPCLQELKCSHRCSGTCGQCLQGRIHKVCEEDCGNTLICGHSCPVPCRQVCPPCDKKCQNRCIHSKCSKKCGEPCIECNEPCEYKCVHTKCRRKCGELCDRAPCNEPCQLSFPCGHSCSSFCGEPCPPCRTCHPVHYDFVFFMGEEEEEDSRWILLNDCKHVVEVTGLEQWLQVDQEGSEIKRKACPKCRPTEPNRYITTTMRYMNLVKTTYLDIQSVKKKLFGEVSEIRQRREELLLKVKAMKPQDMTTATETGDSDELVNLYLQLLRDLPLVKNKRKKEIDIRRLQVLDYMVGFLTSVVERKKKIWGQLNDECKLKMSIKLNRLTAALLKREKKISIPEMESFDKEKNRIEKCGDLMILESSGEYRQLKANPEVIKFFKQAEDLVNRFSEYSPELNEKVFEAIDKVRVAIKSNATLSEKEKKEILDAMKSSFYGGVNASGHFFKCPNGHIYCITECGGAMETAKCPMDGCGELIGGASHRYLSNVRLASEIDGAKHAAWPSGNEMNNYQF